MTEQAAAAAAGALESSDKQKKILAAKKKLKSFQAKRAATTAPEGHAARLDAVSAELSQEQAACADARRDVQRLHDEAAQQTRDADAERASASAREADQTRQLESEHSARVAAEAAHADALAAVATLEERCAKLTEDLHIEAEAAREAFEELASELHGLEARHARLTSAHARLSDNHLRAIASTQAWLSELHDAGARHQAEVETWADTDDRPGAEPNGKPGAEPPASRQRQRQQRRQ
ncbi:hypothetical protein GGI04_003662 [Coemansia thaxteri]|nr:hypothetical protein GGI04_003662 [Coemansia thaxteri]